MTATQSLDKPTIFFDGYCNLCNSSVQFIIKRDRKALFQFASLQSELGEQILTENGLKAEQYDSLLLVINGRVFTYSTAVLEIAKQLDGIWPLCYAAIIIPVGIRNWIYRYIARNRYRWFGKKASCQLYPPALQKRIMDGNKVN